MSEFRVQSPNEKQKLFFLSDKKYTAYGGARGGGKSFAVRKKACLLCFNYSGIKVLILRKTYPELRENHIIPLQAELKDIASFKEKEKAFIFPNGSRIKFGYCEHEKDVNQYQGQEFDIIFFDEATHFTEKMFDAIKACLRGANSFPKRIYFTCNPGGVGHSWVKRLFIDKEYLKNENPEDYFFIKATVYDNKVLLENDPEYVKLLETLPEDLKEAWLYGNWDSFVGQYFKEFRRDIHVIEPFPIPKSWRRYFAMDYGLDMFAGYFIAMSNEGKAYVYRELYEPNLIISDMVNMIKENTFGEDIYEYIAPPDMWNRRQDTGKSVADIAFEMGINFTLANNDRQTGFLNFKEWLKVYKDEFSKETADLLIFSNCKNLIKSIPYLIYDEKRPGEVSKEPHEFTHAPDAIRYFISSVPQKNKERSNTDNLYRDFNILKEKRYSLGKGGKQNVI